MAQITLFVAGSLGLMLGAASAVRAQVMVIASAASPISEMQLRELRNLYKGRLSRLNGNPVIPLNTRPGSIDRRAFLNQVMEQNELDYTGYWHVRRYSGQGAPPQEVETHEELFERLKANSDLVGYIWTEPGQKPNLPDGLKLIRVR
ncbi:MAG TPA: hypothetical protein VFV39_07400 [Limnobacter sp.]|nr:hypothetical protein [Limnobacter sp.]